MENYRNNLTWALYYRSLGWSPFPLAKGGKEAIVSWKKYQTEIPTVEEITEWWTQWPEANIGIATGKVSGIIVLDLDAKHGRTSKEFKMPITVCAKTGGGGEHYLFRHPGGRIKNSEGLLFGKGVDIRGDGGYFAVAPSLHESGKHYEWTIGPDQEEIAEAPDWLIEAFSKQTEKAEKLWQKGAEGVPEGQRNATAISVAGKLLSSLPPELKETTGWAGLVACNEQNDKPLPEGELREVWESAKSYDSSEGPKDTSPPSKAEKLLAIIENKKDVVLFHDEQTEAHISISISDHQEILALKNRSKAIRRWLTKEYWAKYKKAIGSDIVNEAIAVLEGRACFDGPLFELHNRLAWHEGNLWYDMANDKWQAIKITDTGWEVVDNPPILFHRYTHSLAQVKPSVENGDIRLLFKYINVTDPDQQLLLLIFLISCFVPDFPHPFLVIFGPQGSAKSTLSKLLRRVVDPSLIEVASMPERKVELVQALAHHTFLFFDNVSHISEAESDILCKAVTGSGFVKRELYSDDDDIIYRLKRCIGINGINLVSTRPDLLDRSLLIELDRIEDDQRKSDEEILDSFEKDLPLILGGIFNALTQTLQIRPSIKLAEAPRMADFTLWGSAIAKAIGSTQEEFLRAYRINMSKQTETILNEHIVAMTLILFMEKRSWQKWEGTPTQLLDKLTEQAKSDNERLVYDQHWPKIPQTLSRALNTLKVTLLDANIAITISKGEKRKITIERIASKKVEPAPELVADNASSEDDTDDIDDTN